MWKPSLAIYLIFVAVIAYSSSKPTASSPDFDGKSWWEHIKVLAADDMEGRETGSEAYRKAAQLVAAQFERDGNALRLG